MAARSSRWGRCLPILSIPLPWLKAGGTVLEVAAWTGVGGGLPVLAMFISSVSMLAIMLIPFTTRSGTFWLDRATAYLVLLAIGMVGLVAKAVELMGTEGSISLAPLDAPGLWLAIAGMALMTWGVLRSSRNEAATGSDPRGGSRMPDDAGLASAAAGPVGVVPMAWRYTPTQYPVPHPGGAAPKRPGSPRGQPYRDDAPPPTRQPTAPVRARPRTGPATTGAPGGPGPRRVAHDRAR